MFTYSLSGLEIKGAGESLQEVEENETTSRSAVYQVLGNWFNITHPAHFTNSRDGVWIKDLLTASELLPYQVDFQSDNDTFEIDAEEYGRRWTATFEGNSPEHSLLQFSTYAIDNTHSTSEVTREYEYFGLSKGESTNLPDDHLSTELEFMGFICFKEAATSSDRLRNSYRRAQKDFMTRYVSPVVDGVTSSLADQDMIPPFQWGLLNLKKYFEQDQRYLENLLESPGMPG